MENYQTKRGNVIPLAGTRFCRLCKIYKPASEFSFLWHNTKTAVDYYRRECVHCRKEVIKRPEHVAKKDAAYRRWRDENPDRDWRSRLNCRFRKEYGFSFENACSLLLAQGNMCANRACGIPLVFSRWQRKNRPQNIPVVDHCHRTGMVRGILCDKCNKSIGMAKESANILFGLAEYVARHDGIGG